MALGGEQMGNGCQYPPTGALPKLDETIVLRFLRPLFPPSGYWPLAFVSDI